MGGEVRGKAGVIRPLLPWLAALCILAGFSVLACSWLDHFTWDDDEAVFVLTARAVRQGGRLYDEVWFNYPPGFPQLLHIASAVGGDSMATARASVMACGLLALILVAGLSRTVGSPWGAVFALLLLATAPHFLALSSMVMTEVPAIGLSVGAVWMALAYHRTGRRPWLVLSSLALALGLWIKPTVVPTAVVPLSAVWLTERTSRHRLASAALFMAFTLLPLAIGILFYNPVGFLRQFLLTYVRSKEGFELDLYENARSLARYVLYDKYQLSHVGLLALGGCGWCGLWRRRRAEAILLGAWPLAVVVLLLLHTPLYRHHLIQLLFPVALLAGLGLEALLGVLKGGRRPGRVALCGVLLGLTLAELALSLRVDILSLSQFEADDAEQGEEAVRYLQATTRPGQYLITDAHIIALEADRPVPPELTNTSRMRIRTGQLTGQQVIDIARRAHPAAIVFWERKLDHLDDFVRWVDCHYELALSFSDRHRIYQPRRPVEWEEGTSPLQVRFGDAIRLRGYSVSPRAVQAGDIARVTLYWEATAHPSDDYTAFVHLLDRAGEVVGQDDASPGGGACPTSIWQPGEVIPDVHHVDIDRRGAGGPYRVRVGLYNDDGRLPASDPRGHRLPEDQAVLGLPPDVEGRGASMPTPSYRQEARLGRSVRLMGYDLPDGAVRAGETLSLTLYWQCLEAMTTSYTVFVHLLDAQGKVVAQQDVLPEGGAFPTIGWPPGGVIADPHSIPLPKDVPPGSYRVEVGMYDASSGERLPVFDAAGQRVALDRVLLDTPVQVDGS